MDGMVLIEALHYNRDYDMQKGETKYVTREEAIKCCTACGWAKTDDPTVENGTRDPKRTQIEVHKIIQTHTSKGIK